ncbi:MAG: hypothetical protein O2845_01105 [Proteobacteria bacterium]|nr:hypothetical protein [Pseudomonadota bacterium]
MEHSVSMLRKIPAKIKNPIQRARQNGFFSALASIYESPRKLVQIGDEQTLPSTNWVVNKKTLYAFWGKLRNSEPGCEEGGGMMGGGMMGGNGMEKRMEMMEHQEAMRPGR